MHGDSEIFHNHIPIWCSEFHLSDPSPEPVVWGPYPVAWPTQWDLLCGCPDLTAVFQDTNNQTAEARPAASWWNLPDPAGAAGVLDPTWGMDIRFLKILEFDMLKNDEQLMLKDYNFLKAATCTIPGPGVLLCFFFPEHGPLVGQTFVLWGGNTEHQKKVGVGKFHIQLV